ncbi:Adenylyl cyclase-associated protein 1 [Geodia barretti]|uniref:Adenylyl cyclase-associated protein 1 n=1 Tax=Geodia barretti TaxID=519541 RepID=A0AA35QSV2_GEOBA|nr:Adenylyl cyclase-associated protein 1 [Geodia barretti]
MFSCYFSPGDALEFVDEYKTCVIQGKLVKYFELSAKIGGDVATQAEIVKSAFQVQTTFLTAAGTHKAPPPAVLQEALKPTSRKVGDVQGYCDRNRGSKMFNHLMAVKEGIGCIGWVTVAPKPANYVKESADQSQFYTNRIIKEYKGKDENHVEWARAFVAAIMDLRDYVKVHHTTGLSWNPEGPVLSASGGAPPPPGGPGAPPPPPPPAVVPPSDAAAPDPEADKKSALLADLSKGAAVTKGLKKVTDDMKTHKNPALRGSSVVKASVKSSSTTTTPKYGATVAAKKPPKLELQNKKWIVEYQENQKGLQITETNPKQTVYMYKCTGSTLVIKGKCNSIVLDNCKKCALVFDDVISSCEIINCQSTQVQVNGKCPTVSIDKTDGCQVYLSKVSVSCEIVSAKSSEMNICVPKGTDGEFSEHPVPEQFKTMWNGKQLVTTASDLNL